MAEKRFLKGLFKDTGNIDQPEGTWRHARNMILNETDGAVSNEGGVKRKGTLPGGFTSQDYKVIGTIEVNDNRVILFLADVVTSTTPTTAPRSEIGIWEAGEYTTLLNLPITAGSGKPTNDLNFRESYPIEGTFKINSKGELIIYWTDDLNPPRVLNVNRQRHSGSVTFASKLYGVSALTVDNIDILNLFPYSGPVPHVELDDQGTHQGSVIEGGGLLTAVYYLALAYVDEEYVSTNYLTVSNPISIVDEFDATIPTNKKDGARAGSQSTKAIKWDISNLNITYKYLRPVVIRSKGNAREAFKLNDIEFSTNTVSVVFSGLETSATGSVEEVIIDTIAYDTAKTIQQLDNILYLGNTTGSKDVGYQKYANNIKLISRVDDIDPFDEFYASVDNLETGWGYVPVNDFGGNVQTVDPTKSYRYAPNIFKWKGYMRDEIYAFYIAFILKDGSTSYAYHIPGREAVSGWNERSPVDTLTPTSTYGTLWGDIHNTSPAYSKRFHWIDSRADAISGGSWTGSLSNSMNYWENATEFYPNTDNYEVWDETGQLSGAAGSIKGDNVRHHHFPSNRLSSRCSITPDKLCRTAISTGSATPAAPWNGWFSYHYTGSDGQIAPGSPKNALVFDDDLTNPNRCSFNRFLMGSNNLSTAANADQLFDGQVFTADQAMQVKVVARVWFEKEFKNGPGGNQGSGGAGRMTPTWIWTNTNAIAAIAADTACLNPTPLTPDLTCGSACNPGPICAADAIGDWGDCSTVNGGNDCDYNETGQITYDLQAGEQIWINAACHPTTTGKVVRQARGTGQGSYGTRGCTCASNYFTNSAASGANYFAPTPPFNNDGAGGMGAQCQSIIEFEVNAGSPIDPNDLHDAKISHRVRRLGFDLEDIKIPQSIADKVQGFRIYYAKRKHSDRTILGQAPLIPAMYKNSRLGMCQEASQVPESAQVLSTLQTIPENFYNMDPYARTWNDYPQGFYNYYDSGAGNINTTTNSIMDVFSFHDFYLLRTKNSLASATHISLEYNVQNFAFNGPALNQNKKMVTILTDSGGTEPIEMKEEWGWDTAQNCYPRQMSTTILIGARYARMNTYELPRLIGQKAKTYLLGDSIFKGDSLGFGGKLFNEFGESCIVFKLMDNHALGAFVFKSFPTSNNTGHFFDTYGVGATELEFGHYGVPSDSFSILTNTMDNSGNFNTSGPARSHGLRSSEAIANLKAFKTDVYKSIDSQELVWTGFEVLGDDLTNFVFAPDGTKYGTCKTKTDFPDGIYGGDTFICRYGITTSLKPSNIESPSNPEKAIHHHIVESTDNINFRHTEDDDSMYFPNGIAKAILREAGPKDFHHFDNMKYNENYSENNDIRPAFPLPLRGVIQEDFPTRTHRSVKHDTTSIIDNYRIFLANQFKDLPKNRGDLWKLSSFNNLLYFHMEESLYASQGKQTMSMKDGSEAFVGSGDIFAQEPNELVQTEGGFGGTQSQWASLTTRYGYFFVDAASKKVFLMKDQLSEISSLGMSKWFEDNLKFTLASYGYPGTEDNPLIGLGFTSVYDPKHKRIILTKRDLKPTLAFINGHNVPSTSLTTSTGTIRWNRDYNRFAIFQVLCTGGGPGGGPVTCVDTWVALDWDDASYFTKEKGWTISYYPELGVWGSFHDYVPYIYFNTSTDFYSLTDKFGRPVWNNTLNVASHLGTSYGNNAIWEHNSTSNYGIIYQEWSSHTSNITEPEWLTIVDRVSFEFEFIHNEFKAEDTLLAAFNYTLETFNQAGISVLEHGFTSFFVYNTLQMSGESILEYFINTRRVGNNWKINRFRDMAAVVDQTGNTTTGLNLPNTSPYYMSTNTNVIGGTNTGTITTSSTENMFTYDGMSKTLNPNYLDLTKNWNLQRKFIDKWVGIRLIYDNISNNLLNLYATNVAVRKSFR